MKFLPFLVQSQDLGLRILSLNPEIPVLLCSFPLSVGCHVGLNFWAFFG
ncbi:hypothetical protein SLEP1_g55124 [Rubroshorea leprosula]|uniref:Uncharacterized protein n=1 Tax=Rubroshorea leprosula TaxID=152421 RepID=A0AAV5MFJ4_9ROSI|nr:hypothetical protein SLEP1_g55124 [Rubroshorea leprosula]